MRLLLLGLLACFVLAGCSGHGKSVADPFAHGLPGGRVVTDQMICDPTPTMCTRYVVIAPTGGTSQTALLQAAAAMGQQHLGWRPDRYATGATLNGLAFGTSSPDRGGFVNEATAELGRETGVLGVGASAVAGNKVLQALRDNPGGIAIRIIDNR